MRTYEILAAGCVPVFAGLEGAPTGGAMAMLPRGLLAAARMVPGLKLHRDDSSNGYTTSG